MSNLLTNGDAEAGTTAGFGTTQGTLANVTTTPYEGARSFSFTSTGTGNRNLQSSPPVACSVGDFFSCEAYVRWLTGTIKQISVMCQFLDAANVQTGNFIGSLVTPTTSGYTLVQSLNAGPAPTLTTQVRFQLRINSAASGDVVLFDDAWMNEGATIDRSAPPDTGWSVWNGTSEVAAEVSVWNGTAEVPMDSSSVP